jgi:predicted ArsR family transcriptional regulator
MSVKQYLNRLDKLLDSRVRLALMALLVATDWVDFTTFKDELDLSDGNLASHLRKLEEASYIELRKGFVGRKPLTSYRATEVGRKAFEKHFEALAAMVRPDK